MIELLSPAGSIDALRAGVHYFMHIAIPEAQIVPLVTDMLHDPAYGRVYRIKGCLPAADGGRLKLNAVGETVALDPIPEGQAVLIVIGDLRYGKLHPSCL